VVCSNGAAVSFEGLGPSNEGVSVVVSGLLLARQETLLRVKQGEYCVHTLIKRTLSVVESRNSRSWLPYLHNVLTALSPDCSKNGGNVAGKVSSALHIFLYFLSEYYFHGVASTRGKVARQVNNWHAHLRCE
jgi:hypothetical protein